MTKEQIDRLLLLEKELPLDFPHSASQLVHDFAQAVEELRGKLEQANDLCKRARNRLEWCRQDVCWLDEALPLFE
jgi:hypothetical protein